MSLLPDGQMGSPGVILTAGQNLGKRLLYLDAMNCAGWFFGGSSAEDSGSHEAAVRSMPKRVRRFMEAARTSGYSEVAVFIDAAMVTDEAQGKWRDRRLQEVRNGWN